ncbi:MAG: anti-sigma factor family protein [Vulcanimicrobiaceae bacterium]
MRCSSCEPLLDQYIEGTLIVREMNGVREHLRECAMCTSLIAELRVVDALLATTVKHELPPNFTFAVMAQARSLSAPSTARGSIWTMFGVYLIATWIALSAGFWAFGTRASLASLSLRDALAHAFGALSGAAHAFAPATPLVIGGMVTILAVDVVLVCGVVAFYTHVRPRLIAHLVPLEAS